MHWLQVSQFSRGALGALGLLGVAENILPYKAFDLASGMHSAILGWNIITERLGLIFAEAIGLPELSSEAINVALISLTIGPAWAYAFSITEWPKHPNLEQKIVSIFPVIYVSIVILLMSIMFVKSNPGSVEFFIPLGLLLLAFSGVMRNLPIYRNGVLAVLGFLLTLEGVYVIGTSRVQTAFDSFVCEQAASIAPRCKG